MEKCAHHDIFEKAIEKNRDWAEKENRTLFKRTEDNGKEIAVIQNDIHQNKEDINGLGQTVKKIPAIDNKLTSLNWIMGIAAVALVGNSLSSCGSNAWSHRKRPYQKHPRLLPRMPLK